MDSATGAYASLAVGFLLLIAFGELSFLENFETTGWLFGIFFCSVGIVLLLSRGDNQSMLIALLAICIGIPLYSALYHDFPPLPFSRRLIKSHEDDVTVASISANVELEDLRGRVGRVVSPLRPSGIADFDGRRVDVITQGMMVETGSYVRCLEVRAGRVIVSPVEKPATTDLERDDFS